MFDALITVRPYKQAWTVDEALSWMSENSGKLFDPMAINALQQFSDDGALHKILEQLHD